jgi:hypothetical protein
LLLAGLTRIQAIDFTRTCYGTRHLVFALVPFIFVSAIKPPMVVGKITR